jgi:hypothetical protein
MGDTKDYYNGYKLIADIWGSLVTLLVALVWPAIVIVLIRVVARNGDAIRKSISDFMKDMQSFKVSAGSVGVEIVSKQVQGVLTQQIAKETGAVSVEQRDAVKRVANDAAAKLLQQGTPPPDARMKILWVDDHPENNVNLQFAFQAPWNDGGVRRQQRWHLGGVRHGEWL